MTHESYEYCAPAHQSSCVIFSSPHSGRAYSESFLQNAILDSDQIRMSEDAFVDDLFDIAPEYGAPLLVANAPRAFVDLNRRADELDGALIKGVAKSVLNPRVASGLGVIPRIVAEGRVIQSGKMTLKEASKRLNDFYYPYHDKLKSIVAKTRVEFGQSMLIDCHSMPHGATTNMVVRGGGRPDVVLGDRFGASAGGAITDQIEDAFVSQGFSVSRNVPFAGAYIIQEYGRPSAGQHAVQIELDRSIYMNEEMIVKNQQYAQTKRRLGEVIKQIIQIGAHQLPLAAE